VPKENKEIKKPFLEIFVEAKIDPDLSIKAILDLAKSSIVNYVPIAPERVEITPKPSLYLEFPSKAAFEALYEKDYRIYSYLLEKILSEKLEISPRKTEEPSSSSRPFQNYIILRYRSNYLAPMRRNYGLIYRVNEFLGSHISHEEVHDGFLRFIRTKADFDALLIGNDDFADWMAFLRTLGVDMTQPRFKNF